ncbi:hypothetical protein PIB30_045798 [Stylosanthes scabra]|uniref:Uncharacterized protein n=1 Tax=Stylosanthes scabra TaxID=79078 RepID=A0ABU6ZF04_9FABA|nr:hypothetical protein [Stylosanthes scabra]
MAAAASYDNNETIFDELRLRYRNSGKYHMARIESKKGLSMSITNSVNSDDFEGHRRWFSVTTSHMQRRSRLGSNKTSHSLSPSRSSAVPNSTTVAVKEFRRARSLSFQAWTIFPSQAWRPQPLMATTCVQKRRQPPFSLQISLSLRRSVTLFPYRRRWRRKPWRKATATPSSSSILSISLYLGLSLALSLAPATAATAGLKADGTNPSFLSLRSVCKDGRW